MPITTPSPNQLFSKDSEAEEHYRVDFGLDVDDGDSVESITVLESDDGITVEGESVAGNVLTVRLTGGTVGQRYRVRAKAVYASGRERVWSIWVDVKRE